MDNIIEMPITSRQRIKNSRGKTSVNCLISDRWLKFYNQSSMLHSGEALKLDVMTTNQNGEDKTLCTLIITKEELLSALKNIKCVNT